ncbi:hypothetical protein LJR098_003356 [Rhizobium sp. LjRoot98]|uniref:hypothetical protein n=1 Tax=Rhizobium sp. LjRoot98 TaxID=3342345 RepID=UPI003ED0C3D9
MLGDSHQRLEAISDPAVFERLATAVLRRHCRLSGTIIHVGVNSDGKTVRAPVDGIAVASANGGHLVVHQHSITDRSSLRDKWLGPDGDVEKAWGILLEERLKNPGIGMSLYLTTNRIPRQDLVREVHALAKRRGFTVRILEQSEIADFLDIDEDGQWIRFHHLGVNQVRLSLDRLNEISAESSRSYDAHISNDPKSRVGRVFQEQVQARVSKPGFTFLSMPSGSGKSTFCADLLSLWVGLGNQGLWLHQDGVQATTASSAIANYLQAMSPGLSPHCGNEALATARNAPLLVIIDDINHLPNRTELVKKVCGWGTDPRGKLSNFHLIVPVWPETLERVDQALLHILQGNIISAGGFIKSEAVTAALRLAERAGIELTKLSAGEVTKSLGYDPLLIGLWDPAENFGQSPEGILASFMSKACSEATDAAATSWDLSVALEALAYHMLENRNLDPTWRDVVDWFANSADSLSALRRLTNQKRILSVSEERLGFRLQFRHDRVRAALLSKALRTKMNTGELPREIWREPYYADFLGEALVLPVISKDLLLLADQLNPLALAFALGAAIGGDERQCLMVVEALRNWLSSPIGRSSASESLRWEIQLVLSRIESSHILGLCKLFPKRTWALSAAGLRNGDAISGASFCFSNKPSLHYTYRDDLVAHARVRHPDVLIGAITNALSVETDRDRITGYLNFSGELGLPELADPMLDSWHRVGSSDVSRYFWPLAQCGYRDPSRYLDSVLDAWESHEAARAEGEGDGLLADSSIVHAFKRRMPKPIIGYLIERAKKGGKIADLIKSQLFASIDDPNALLSYANWRADISREREAKGEETFFFSDMTRRMSSKHSPYSVETRNALMASWKNPLEDWLVRKQTFAVWYDIATAEDVPALQDVARTDPLYDGALRRRAELGDRTSLTEIGERLDALDLNHSWWACLRNSWDGAEFEILDAEFSRWANGATRVDWASNHFIPEVVLKMRPTEAEKLLTKHWDILSKIRQFVHVALYVARAELLSRVHRQLAESGNIAEILKFLTSTWQVGGTESLGEVTVSRLEAIKPYLSHLDEMEIEHIWTACNRAGLFSWRREFLDQFLSPKFATAGEVDDEALIEKLRSFVGKDYHLGDAHYMVERSIRRGDPPERLPSILKRWLIAENSIAALKIVGDFLAAINLRRHLDILTAIELNSDEAATVRENTRYAVMRNNLS